MRDLYERKSLFDTQNFLPVKTSAEGQAMLTKLFFVKNQKELDKVSQKVFSGDRKTSIRKKQQPRKYSPRKKPPKK